MDRLDVTDTLMEGTFGRICTGEIHKEEQDPLPVLVKLATGEVLAGVRRGLSHRLLHVGYTTLHHILYAAIQKLLHSWQSPFESLYVLLKK